jgi:hypothetical protein
MIDLIHKKQHRDLHLFANKHRITQGIVNGSSYIKAGNDAVEHVVNLAKAICAFSIHAVIQAVRPAPEKAAEPNTGLHAAVQNFGFHANFASILSVIKAFPTLASFIVFGCCRLALLPTIFQLVQGHAPKSACLRISQLDHEVFSSKIEITYLRCLLDKVTAFFNAFRSKINTRAEVPSEIFSVLDSLDCRSLDSLTICSQKIESVLVTDSVFVSTSDLSSGIVDHLHSATCNDCLAFNSSFISSAWASVFQSGLGFIRHATNRAASSALLAPLYTRLDLRTHLTDDERSV